MGKEQQLTCPRCSKNHIVQNGHHHQGKTQFYCKTCHKYFYKDPAKGYPPTNIPFPVIAYLLYFRKKIPVFSNVRKYRKFVSKWLNYLKFKKGEISRQIIHHWIKHYEHDIETIISFQEAQDYVHRILSENLKDLSREELKTKTYPYKQTLQILQQFLGHQFCVELVRHDPFFFKELADIVSKQPLYYHWLKIEGKHPVGFFFEEVI